MLGLRKSFRTKLTALRAIFTWETPTTSIVEKIQVVVLPSLLIIGIGILEINYPDALAGFDYGHDLSGLAENFRAYFAVVDQAIASGDNNQLALALNSITEVAKSSPFKDLANLASFQAALDDPKHVWEF